MAQAVVGDAKVSLMELSQALGSWKADDNWYKKSREELKNWIIGHYGMAGWENLLKEEGRIRRQRQEAIYAIEEQKRKMRDYTIIGIALFVGCACIFWGIWFVSVAVTSR